MLEVHIVDESCADDEAHIFKDIPLDTEWAEIQAAVRLLYPTTTQVTILVVEED